MKRATFLWPVVVILLLPGCTGGDQGNFAPPGSAWEDSVNVPILKPLQGRWQFDQQRTFAQMEADGRPKAEVDRIRKMYEKMATQKVPPELERGLRAGGIDPKVIGPPTCSTGSPAEEPCRVATFLRRPV